MKYGFRAPRPKKLYYPLYQYVFTLSIKHINIIGFIFIVKTCKLLGYKKHQLHLAVGATFTSKDIIYSKYILLGNIRLSFI